MSKKKKIIGIDGGNVVGVPVSDPDRYRNWTDLDNEEPYEAPGATKKRTGKKKPKQNDASS